MVRLRACLLPPYPRVFPTLPKGTPFRGVRGETSRKPPGYRERGGTFPRERKNIFDRWRMEVAQVTPGRGTFVARFTNVSVYQRSLTPARYPIPADVFRLLSQKLAVFTSSDLEKFEGFPIYGRGVNHFPRNQEGRKFFGFQKNFADRMYD